MFQSNISDIIVVKDGEHVHHVSDEHGNLETLLNTEIEEWLELYVGDNWGLYTVDEDTHEILDEIEEGFWPFTRSAVAFCNANDALAFKLWWY
ncbi:protein of unknown function [Methylorubrum extorquens DM4]|uniref:Uncharacterized protein n=1 Tax=Methylorubrum extorquens (strain DSM 6343 / CIP 106787 / DM4) TaxID=661410 RepID=C7CC98_METED|nr:hypothetical protein [Methylorubrum extorquens]CAX22444.1 protein of unknown function [Methylorubrum extorquens DM4]